MPNFFNKEKEGYCKTAYFSEKIKELSEKNESDGCQNKKAIITLIEALFRLSRALEEYDEQSKHQPQSNSANKTDEKFHAHVAKIKGLKQILSKDGNIENLAKFINFINGTEEQRPDFSGLSEVLILLCVVTAMSIAITILAVLICPPAILPFMLMIGYSGLVGMLFGGLSSLRQETNNEIAVINCLAQVSKSYATFLEGESPPCLIVRNPCPVGESERKFNIPLRLVL